MNSAEQLTLVCYTCVYLRYMKDGSLLLAVLAAVVVSLADFLATLTTTYLKHNSHPHHDSFTPTDSPVVRAIVLKALRYLQVLLLVQTAYLLPYHATLAQPHGFVDLRIIDERDRQGSWQLWALDLAVTLLELALISEALRPEYAGRRLALPQLQTHRYGILALLRFDTWSPAVCRDGPELSVVAKPTTRYGSTATATEPPDARAHG
ncbi:hypothetical protein HG536_0F03480 [Torulaspora globosa]|uniref:DUF1746 domain-containing protein n=1 Tax=Torulaspora globosa TaxID=48254 RepID=A0A7G3ZKI7_9SACH|nr:uncharacterized protein HG536_0F03480 [Torulaspora globosa]QLL34023.1 hypothetical protein HG536_0F03480 [Torulaspora globosa]